jgi:integrase
VRRAGVVKPATVNREVDTLKSMFNRAVEWKYLKASPAAGVKKLKVQKLPPAYLNIEQLGKLLEQCTEPYLYIFVVLGAYLGLRRGEIFRLTWSDVDFNRREITVREAKNNEFRVIPMNDLVIETLKKHTRHIKSDVVLARSDTDGKAYQDIRDSYQTALRQAGLHRIRIHDLRHSFASNLVTAGESLAVVMELMGHKDIQTTMIYAHLAPNQKRNAVDRLVEGQDKNTAPDAQRFQA